MRSVCALLAVLASLGAISLPAAAGARIDRTDFVVAYVACNNAAWTEQRRTIFFTKQPTRSDLMRGLDTAEVRAFVGEFLYYDGVYGNFQPHLAATVGWALATKSFADRGEIEPRFRRRNAANALLRRHRLAGVDALSDAQAGAIATELYIATLDHGRNAITPIAMGTHLDAQLDATTARTMLAKIGTHFDVGGPRAHVQPGAACPQSILGGQFRGKS